MITNNALTFCLFCTCLSAQKLVSKPSDKSLLVRIPKCCKSLQVLTQDGCASGTEVFDPRMISVLEHNATHLNEEPIKDVTYEAYVSPVICPYQKYPLIPGEDNFALLRNGSLVVMSKQVILPPEGYCIETVDLGEAGKNANWITTPIVCFTSDLPLAGTIFVVYASGILLSAVFLLVTALVFFSVKEVRDTRGKCVVGYAVSMAIAFVCLASAQLSGIEQNTCAILGFFIQFSLVAGFTWLSNLTWETYTKIKKYNSHAYSMDRRRLYYYVSVGLGVPTLILVITLIADRIPAIPSALFKPEFGKNACWFDQKQLTVMYFYVPIASAILFNVVLSGLMKWNLVQLEKTGKEDVAWLAAKRDLKPMYRSCSFLLVLMSLTWLMEIVSFFAQTDSGIWTAIDVINSLQGLWVFLIFVLHRPVKNKLSWCSQGTPKRMTYEEDDVRLNGDVSNKPENGR